MRILLVCLLTLSLLPVAFACDKCGSSSSCSHNCDPYKHADWGYAYNDPHYIPDSAPAALHNFYDRMVPMMEARKSGESAYLREYAECLYRASREVPGSLEDGTYHQRKHFNHAARSLRQNCAELRELAWGSASSSLYSEMREIEADFVKLCNLSDSN